MGNFVPKTDSIADQKTVEVPLYTYLDVARYLRIPTWFALSASVRPSYRPMEYFERFWHRSFRNVFADDYGPVFSEDEAERIPFRSFASLFVYTAVLRDFFSEIRRPWRQPEEAFHLFDLLHQAGRRVVSDPKVFTDPDWVVDQSDRIFGRVEESDRAQLLKFIALHQSRVERSDVIPIRLYPFSRDPAPDGPRTVVIDPEIRFGRPTVKGAPTDVLIERWRAGDSSAELADDYGLTTVEIDEALRYEAIPNLTPFLFPFPPFGR
jgi:uncharacterized protein (DUF433 family)